MTDHTDLRDLSDAIGPLTPSTPAEKTAALRACLRAAADADEAARFLAALGIGEVPC